MARRRVKDFTDDLTPDEWFWHPAEYTTHVAWQVGHLAVSEYNLCLRRVRGRTQADESLIPDAFIEHFKLGSQPVAGSGELSADRRDQARVRRGARPGAQGVGSALGRGARTFPSSSRTRCSRRSSARSTTPSSHEMVHNGQIGLLRRLMGKPALR